MSTKEDPGPFDGLERAEPTEPVFTLRAHDVFAAPLVHEWVRLRREAINRGDMTDEKRELELIQCREAEEIAWAMTDWREGRAEQEEAKESTRPMYSGNKMPAEELAAKKRHDTLKGCSSVINNLVAETTDAIASIDDLGFPVPQDRAAAAVAILKHVSETIRPKRASYHHVEG